MMLYAGIPWFNNKDVDLDNRLLFVRAGKGDKDRSVPLPAILLDTLRARCQDDRLTTMVNGVLIMVAIGLASAQTAEPATVNERHPPGFSPSPMGPEPVHITKSPPS